MTPTREAVTRESKKYFYHFHTGKNNTLLIAIQSRAVLKKILEPDDSKLLKQQVLPIHRGVNALIPRSKFH